jgi:hypothetical protein
MVGSDLSIILIQAGPPSLPSTSLQRFARSRFPTASSSLPASDDLPLPAKHHPFRDSVQGSSFLWRANEHWSGQAASARTVSRLRTLARRPRPPPPPPRAARRRRSRAGRGDGRGAGPSRNRAWRRAAAQRRRGRGRRRGQLPSAGARPSRAGGRGGPPPRAAPRGAPSPGPPPTPWAAPAPSPPPTARTPSEPTGQGQRRGRTRRCVWEGGEKEGAEGALRSMARIKDSFFFGFFFVRLVWGGRRGNAWCTGRDDEATEVWTWCMDYLLFWRAERCDARVWTGCIQCSDVGGGWLACPPGSSHAPTPSDKAGERPPLADLRPMPRSHVGSPRRRRRRTGRCRRG